MKINNLFTSDETIYYSKTYEYNESNQLINIIEENLSTNRFYRALISYDTNGNISQITRQTSDNGTNYTTLETSNYTYDNKKTQHIMSIKLQEHHQTFLL